MVRIFRALIFICLLFSNCTKIPNNPTKWHSGLAVKDSMDAKELQNWHLKDIIQDSVPGISFNRAVESKLLQNIGEKIIIAVLDTEIDIHHETLKSVIWENVDEIPSNGIDDDRNGYIDDFRGWNFLGNQGGESLIFQNHESIRIIRAYEKESSFFPIPESKYRQAKEILETNLNQIKSDIEYVQFLRETYPKSEAFLKTLYPEENYSLEDLDSLYTIYEAKDPKVADLIFFMSDYIRYDLTEQWVDNYETRTNNRANFIYNMAYDDRSVQGDNVLDINDKFYGNNKVANNIGQLYHGTQMASLIAGQNRSIYSTPLGICESCIIMPVCISANGSEHDKDIATGIRYAVDNGARIINMSFGKQLSLKSEWVYDALKYAEKNNVLVVTSAGNSNLNLDLKNEYYPNNFSKGEEVSDSFLMVGSSSYLIGDNLLSYFSNYGQRHLDILAPGELIETAKPNNQYFVDSGTSISSAIVSGIGGVILSKYPYMTSKELKEIIINSGVEYDIQVKVLDDEDEKVDTSFLVISKTGRIANLYNALLLAEKIANK